MGQPALDLSPELGEPGLYHDTGRHGFFAVLQRRDGRTRQESFRLSHLPEVLRLLPRDRDSWISQAEFTKPNRRLVNLARVGLQFVDLDTYKTHYGRLSPTQQVGAVLDHLDDAGKPLPSLILASGRGLQAKWLLDGTLPRRALPRWNAVQEHAVRALKPFGADAKARDASRVLRLEHTVNTRSGERVEVLWVNGCGGHLVRYDFELLAHEFLPLAREDLARHREEARRRNAGREARRSALRVILGGRHGLRRFSERQLWWDRVEDLRLLAKLRGWHRGNPPGHRDAFLFLAVVGMSWAVEPPLLYQEALALAREFAPTWSPEEVRNAAGAAIRRAVLHARGDTVEFRGQHVDRRYRFRNRTLIEWLEVTPDEERRLTTIISRDEKRRRDRLSTAQARREAGAMPRAEYEARARDRRDQARQLRRLGRSYRDIAVALGVSKRWVITMLHSERAEEGVNSPSVCMYGEAHEGMALRG